VAKTLLAEAVASTSGLNYIPVKVGGKGLLAEAVASTSGLNYIPVKVGGKDPSGRGCGLHFRPQLHPCQGRWQKVRYGPLIGGWRLRQRLDVITSILDYHYLTLCMDQLMVLGEEGRFRASVLGYACHLNWFPLWVRNRPIVC
jgi:hypothetical protein